MEKTEQELEVMKKEMMSIHEMAIKAAYDYFSSLPVGAHRSSAYEFYQNLLYAARK